MFGARHVRRGSPTSHETLAQQGHPDTHTSAHAHFNRLVTVRSVQVKKMKADSGRKAKKETVIVVDFSGALSSVSADNASAYDLSPIIKVKASGKGKHKKPATTKLGALSPVASAVYSNDQVTLTPRVKLTSSKPQELIVNGALVTDTLGRGIDGADDGMAGSDYIATIAGTHVTSGGISLARTARRTPTTAAVVDMLLSRGELGG